MVKKDINQMLIESVVRRTLKNISASPKRSLRNIIDLALNFSSDFPESISQSCSIHAAESKKCLL